MEITTLIKWNALVYLLYYGLNLGYDYLTKRQGPERETVRYSYKDLLEETPTRVEPADLVIQKPVGAKILAGETSKPKEQVKVDLPIEHQGPVEDQGIPLQEFLNNARNFSSNINF